MQALTERIVEERLDFDEIRNDVAQNAFNDESKKLILHGNIPTDTTEILNEHRYVKEALELLRFEAQLPLRTFQDIRNDLKYLRINDSILSCEKFLHILNVLQIASQIHRFFEGKEDKYPQLYKLQSFISDLIPLQKQIAAVVDDDGRMRDNASPALAKIRKEILRLESQCRNKIQELIQHQYKAIVNDDILTMRNGRLVIAVRSDAIHEVDGLIHGHSNTGATFYIEPNENIKITSKIETLRSDELKEMDRILRQLADTCRENLSPSARNCEILLDLDRIYCKASYGLKYNATLAEINQKEYLIELFEAYHPLLLKKYGQIKAIPLTLSFGNSANKILLISGPNAGGKTISLKTVAVLVMMNQLSIPIPAKRAQLPILKKIFADIGDSQSLENDLSTFTSHLIKMKDIVKNATIDSLVLVDEMGTGTDPTEGAALAKVFLEYLLRRSSLVIATSHLGDLKLFANHTHGIENASMEFNSEELEPNFRLKQGVPGQSFAVEIAQRAGIHTDLINRAKQLIGTDRLAIEHLIRDLNEKIRNQDKLNGELAESLKHYQELEQLNQQKQKELREKERKIKTELFAEYESEIRRLNNEIEKAVSDIRNRSAEKESIVLAKSIIHEAKDKLSKHKNTEFKKRNHSDFKFQIGDRVKHLAFSVIAEIVEIKGSTIEISNSNSKLKCQVEDLQFISRPESEKTKNINNFGITLKVVKNEIDLRGLDADDAWQKCDEYLFHAQMNRWNEISIIHGKGTGALREMIRSKLKFDKRIKNYRLAGHGEGDSGVTIVQLRLDN